MSRYLVTKDSLQTEKRRGPLQNATDNKFFKDQLKGLLKKVKRPIKKLVKKGYNVQNEIVKTENAKARSTGNS